MHGVKSSRRSLSTHPTPTPTPSSRGNHPAPTPDHSHRLAAGHREFWATSLIILFGAGVECQVTLHSHPATSTHDNTFGNYLQCRLAWAVGVALAIFTAGGISGAHCNPTITLALTLFRGFPRRKLPTFLLSQTLGAALGALLVYAAYAPAISRFEGSSTARTVLGPHATSGLFFTHPAPHLPYPTAFYTEFLASALLVGVVFALSDKTNLAPPRGTMPFAMFLALLGIGAAFGVNTGYAVNGARDLGPRLALTLVGYGRDVWTHDAFYWAWAPWGASMCGGVVGGLVYDAFLYTGRDSPVNRPRGGGRKGVEL